MSGGLQLSFGVMNNPEKRLKSDLNLLADLDLEYIELTVEWPESRPELVRENLPWLADFLAERGLGILIHTPWYLEIASPYAPVREGALSIGRDIIELAAELDSPLVTFHPYTPGWLSGTSKRRVEARRLNASSMSSLVEMGSEVGVQVLVENVDHGAFSSVSDLAFLLNEVPHLGLTLDIGHAFLGGGEDKLRSYFDKLGERVLHVHVHDNFGRGDDHLPVGAGRVPWRKVGELLASLPYEGTVTIEAHVQDREYLRFSRERLLAYWRRWLSAEEE